MNESIWINYRELRARLSMTRVLRHYHIPFTIRGERAIAPCPLPTHGTPTGTPSFFADLRRGTWECRGCNTTGGVLDLCCRLEGFDPSDTTGFRTAMLSVITAFGVDGVLGKGSGQRIERVAEATRTATQAASTRPAPPSVVVNAPIEFELSTLDAGLPCLLERGLTPETIGTFGLGYATRGVLKGRIAIPLHAADGRLLGYCGERVGAVRANERSPGYLFPKDREREGVIRRFDRSLLLFNHHRVTAPADHLFVVPDFASVFWLWQAGYRTVVGLMGERRSTEQGRRIVDLVARDGRVWVIAGCGTAAADCAHAVFEVVGPERPVRWVRLPPDEPLTACPADELAAVLQ